MIKLVKPLISWWRLFRSVGSPSLAYKLLPEIFTPSMRVGDKNFAATIKSADQKYLQLFGGHGELFLKFIKSGNIQFISDSGDRPVACIQMGEADISLYADNYDSLKVIEEIFIDQLYDFHDRNRFVVCDVGMNVGAASLYFASLPNVSRVYGFEPFPSTYDAAMKNLQLNSSLSSRIVPHMYGLGDKQETLKVPVPVNGSLGGSTTQAFINETGTGSGPTVDVKIEEITQVLGRIKSQHANDRLLLKLDCEGAEYAIMEKMEREHLIGSVDIFMIEYHFKGKQSIIDILLRHNFIIMSPVSAEVQQFGMLYAINRN